MRLVSRLRFIVEVGSYKWLLQGHMAKDRTSFKPKRSDHRAHTLSLNPQRFGNPRRRERVHACCFLRVLYCWELLHVHSEYAQCELTSKAAESLSGRQSCKPSDGLAWEGWGHLLGPFPVLWHMWHRRKHGHHGWKCCRTLTQGLFVCAGAISLSTLQWHKMPFNGEKHCVGEDQPSDSDSSRFSESMASLSDYECSRQSFTSDSSSKSSSPACKLTESRGWGVGVEVVLDMPVVF